MAQFYINPYGGYSGFYIDVDEGDDEAKVGKEINKKAKKAGFEEYSVEIMDGSNEELAVWKALGSGDLHFDSLRDFLRIFEEVEEHQIPVVVHLLDVGEGIDYAIEQAEDASVWQLEPSDDLSDAVAEWIEEVGGISELPQQTIESYFDYKSFARDMKINGEVSEVSVGNDRYAIFS